jgi:flagellar biogenesis protein FliO
MFAPKLTALTVSLLIGPGLSYAGNGSKHQPLFDQLSESVDAAAAHNVRLARAQRETSQPAGVATGPSTERTPNVPLGSTERTSSPKAEKAVAKSKASRKRHTPMSKLRERDEKSGQSFGGRYILVGVFLMVLGGVALWLRKRASRPPKGWRRAPTIETIATSRIARKHSISLVRVPGRLLVVAQGDKGLTLLTEMDESVLDSGDEADQEMEEDVGWMDKLMRRRLNWKTQTSRRADVFRTVLNEDAPVDELERLDERSAIKARLRTLRSQS